MENVFLTSLTVPEVTKLFLNALESFHGGQQQKVDLPAAQSQTIEAPVNGKVLSEFIGTSVQNLIRWRKAGKVPYLRLGGRIMYQKSEVIKAIEGKKRG